MNYIGEYLPKWNHAGSKARMDVEFILSHRYGGACEYLCSRQFFTFLQKACYALSPALWSKAVKLLRIAGCNLILQYSLPYDRILRTILGKVVMQNRTVLFVHDVESIRFHGDISVGTDLKIMNDCAIIIVHNEKMAITLRKKGVTAQIVVLELFDYLLEGELPQKERKLSNEVAFAGNLEKSAFLSDGKFESLNLAFNLYGPGFDIQSMGWQNVSYRGSFSTDVIPYELEGSFGLIWDGDTIDTCSGNLGDYMRINNPHKLSLYIAAGLPVITWEQAAIAEFILKYKIGFVVSSLQDIENKIHGLTPTEYEEFFINIKALQKKVTEGYFTNRAFDACEKLLEERY